MTSSTRHSIPTGRHINWCSDGLSFEVPDKDVFVRETLPRYFRHSRFASFQVRAGADGAFGVTSRRWRRLDGVGGRDTSARRRGRERVYAPRDHFITNTAPAQPLRLQEV